MSLFLSLLKIVIVVVVAGEKAVRHVVAAERLRALGHHGECLLLLRLLVGGVRINCDVASLLFVVDSLSLVKQRLERQIKVSPTLDDLYDVYLFVELVSRHLYGSCPSASLAASAALG